MMLHLLIRKSLFACRRLILPSKATGEKAQAIVMELLQ